MTMQQAYIVAAKRTAVGRAKRGSLAETRPDDMAVAVVDDLIAGGGVDPDLVDDVILGCAFPEGEQGMNFARQVVLLSDLPATTCAMTINRFCSSGLEAIHLAALKVASGTAGCVIAGGAETMTMIPMGGNGFAPNPALTAERVGAYLGMGLTAERVAEEDGVSREDQDAFALESQRRAVAAMDQGRFRDEIVPIRVPRRKGEPLVVDTDEHPRYRRDGDRFVLDTDLEGLGRLRPAFREGGTVTAGNASGINDGAAALLLMSRERAEELGLEAMARWIGSASAGVDPGVMGYGPIPATEKLLSRLGLSLDQIGLVELNEAFAAQSLGVMRGLGLDPAITNVNGGAIALGHPTGCSGARILVTLVHEMKRRAASSPAPYFGLATLCVGVGMGVSTVVEWVGASGS